MSVASTVIGASSSPSPTSRTNCSSMPRGNSTSSQSRLDPPPDQVVEDEADEHRERQHELHALGHDAADHPHLTGQVGRADQPRFLDQALGRVVDAPGEPLPGQQPRQEVQEVRLVGDPAARLEDEREDHEVDRRHEQRVEHGPEVAEQAARVPDPQVALHERPHETATTGHRCHPADQRGDLVSACGGSGRHPSGRRGEDTALPCPARSARGERIRCRARGAARRPRRSASRRRRACRAAWRTPPGRRARSAPTG